MNIDSDRALFLAPGAGACALTSGQPQRLQVPACI